MSATAPRRERRTRYVVLGMLLQGPANGYELRQRIDSTIGNFWQESYGQLYPALHELREDGLVATVGSATGAREAQRYEITLAGRDALRAWVVRPPQPQPERNELLLKVFFAELAPAEVGQQVTRAADEATANAARLDALHAQVSERVKGHPALPAWLATIEYGRAGSRVLAEWARRTAAELDAMTSAQPARRSTRAKKPGR